MDRIRIKKLELFAKHGVFPEENALGQKFLVSADLYTDTRKAGLSDDLKASIDYGTVCHKIKDFLEQHTFRLLETVAEKLAWSLLTEISGLEKVTLEIQKPWAPVGLPLETVSVRITRSWHTAYIALGSNLGERETYLKNAVEALNQADGCSVEEVSEFLVTEPYGYTEQNDFLNGCLCLKTLLTPEELLVLLHKLEQEAERKREIRWGPRTLDLDIIFYDDLIVDSRELQIPHGDMQNRDFVLRPLAQIAPYVRHPILRKTVGGMLADLEHSQKI